MTTTMTTMITIMTIMPTVIVSPLAAQLLFRSAAADQVGTPALPDDGWFTYIYKIYHGYNLKENYVLEYILMMLTWLILGLILCTPKAGKAGHDTCF